MKLLRPIALVVVGLALVAYVGASGYFYAIQRGEQYDQTGRLYDLSETGLTTAEVVKIPNLDGSVLTGWYAPPSPGMPVILYYRGNTQSFSREYKRFERWVADGYGFLSFDYRGFPGSPGELSETHVKADALAAFDWLKAKGDAIVIWARSMGSGPGTYVAKEREADALLLETPFMSAVQVALDRGYWWLPLGLILLDKYYVEEWIKDVEEPVFVAHGTSDRTVLAYQGERVYAAARNGKGIWIVPGADHDDLWDAGLWEQARAFFEDVARGDGTQASRPTAG